METSYGIGVRNRFEAYCDDDVEDPYEILKQTEAELDKRKTEKTHKTKLSKNPPIVGPKVIADVPAVKASNATKVPSKTGKVASNLQKVKSSDEKSISNVENSVSSEGWWKEEARKPRGGATNARGMSRGKGISNVFDQRGKREFDRQSGSNKSGVKSIEKRDGSGAHNWGATKNILIEESHYNEESAVEEPNATNQDPIAGGDTSVAEKSKNEEESEMTLDEWKQKQQVKRSVPNFNLRKPGEGESKKWGKVYMLKKKSEDEEEDDDLYDDDINKRGRQKQHLDIEIKFHDVATRGRGRGRGGRIRNVATSEKSSVTAAIIPTSVPKVDDLNDFPTLSIT